MYREAVNKILDRIVSDLLEGIHFSANPTAIILGGQPASGKSNLFDIAKNEHKEQIFPEVNGDMFRQYHPNYSALLKDYISYSSETQIFSSVFTERLIDEACKRKFNRK